MTGKWTRPRWVEVAGLPDGSSLAKCLICPKFATDSRDPGNPANHTSIALMNASAIPVWVRGHQSSAIHHWYETVRPEVEVLTEDEQRIARIFGQEPRFRKPPFPTLSDTKRTGIRPEW